MRDLSVSQHLLENYASYYEGGDLQWRRIGAFEKAKNIISLCANYPHDLILEIGAGEGSVLERLAEQEFGRKLHALEISPSGVKTIKNKNIPNVASAERFDGYNIPFRDGAFDLVVLSHVIEHVEHPRKLLYEAARVGVFVFVEVPLEDNGKLPLDYTFDKVGHINFYSPRTIRQLLQTSRFKILDWRIYNRSKDSYVYQDGTKGLAKYWIKECLLRLFPGVAVSVFTYHQALVCQKL
ncbi:MAG: class I SAM-dependent methyltransferase [Anaerolineales bacterium]|jgi:SAM-dependent methyltransferase